MPVELLARASMLNNTTMKLTTKLNKALKDSDNELEKYVINDVLEAGSDEEIECYIKDVLRGGCQSGTVSGLIYHYDTKAFYIKYIDEIDELYQTTCEETGETLAIGTPMYNWLAWFGFEQTLFNLANSLEIND